MSQIRFSVALESTRLEGTINIPRMILHDAHCHLSQSRIDLFHSSSSDALDISYQPHRARSETRSHTQRSPTHLVQRQNGLDTKVRTNFIRWTLSTICETDPYSIVSLLFGIHHTNEFKNPSRMSHTCWRYNASWNGLTQIQRILLALSQFPQDRLNLCSRL